ncbi:MAG: winged helix-turn-helix transcriptional regulator [Armatimonadetes bacterium]|nr:winged helix-turn-helix transcriptional regulator [Armatimonadota bacterium]
MPKRPTRTLFEMHAQVCQALANPKRLEILDALRDGERSVGQLTATLAVRKANVSQHLAMLRAKGIVVSRRDGQTVYYRLSTPRVIQACDIMRQVLLERLAQSGRLVRMARG